MMARSRHLVRRFVQTVRGREPTPNDLEWVAGRLSSAEKALFDRMTATDQAHAVEVARLTESCGSGVDGRTPDWAIPAALLHDIGKIESGTGVAGRVIATIIDPMLPARIAAAMQSAPGMVGAIGRHLAYPARGASLLGAAGSNQHVRSWAAQHHLPSAEWTVPVEVGQLLQSADDRAS